MESYVVRVYRRYETEPERLVGLVEHPEQGTIEQFNGIAELLNILLAHTQSAEIVATPEDRDEARTSGRPVATFSAAENARHANRADRFHSATPQCAGTRNFLPGIVQRKNQ